MAKTRTEREGARTLLGREYARLISIGMEGPALDPMPATRMGGRSNGIKRGKGRHDSGQVIALLDKS